MAKRKAKKQDGARSGVGDALGNVDEGDENGGGRGISGLEISPHPGQEGEALTARQFNIFGPSNVDRAVFCRQFATMIEVGIPLVQALKLLSVRTSHGKLAGAIADAATGVEEGQSLADSMEQNLRVFSPLVCGIVRVGESGGILEASLVRLAQIMESKADISRKIRAAMMYPTVAVVVAFSVVALIMIKAIPVFAEVYGDVENLPRPTQFIIQTSENLRHGFLFPGDWIIAIVALIVGSQWFRWTEPGKRTLSFVSLKSPIVGRIAKKIGAARFSRTLGGLVSAGIPLIESLAITADTSENVLVSEALRSVSEGVEQGEKMAPALARAKIFPPLVVDMVSIGEETGTLDTMLERIADVYDADVDSTLSGLSSIIEPILIVFLGGTVIFIALAVMLPYFNLVDVIEA